MRRVLLVAAMMLPAVSMPVQAVEKSFALRTALFLQLTDAKDGPLRDVKRSELTADLQGAPDPTVHNAISRALAGAVAVTAASAVLAGAAGALFLIGPDKLDHPATQRHFVAYVPRSVGDKQAAMDLVERTMEDSLVRAYQSQGYEVTVTEKRTTGLFGGEFVRRMIALKGGDVCGKAYGCRLMLSAANSPSLLDKAPSGLPKSESGYYVWKNWKWGDKGHKDGEGIFARVIATELDDPDDLKYPGNVPQISRETLFAASAHMPDWLLVYEPASEGVRYPAIFYRGEEKLFVEPLGAAAPAVATAPAAAAPVGAAATGLVGAGTYAAGAAVHPRDGAVLRGNPTATGVVLLTLASTASVQLGSRMANSFGAWWTVSVDGRSGWLAEADIRAP